MVPIQSRHQHGSLLDFKWFRELQKMPNFAYSQHPAILLPDFVDRCRSNSISGYPGMTPINSSHSADQSDQNWLPRLQKYPNLQEHSKFRNIPTFPSPNSHGSADAMPLLDAPAWRSSIQAVARINRTEFGRPGHKNVQIGLKSFATYSHFTPRVFGIIPT
jgi:hypothetical protein